MPRAQFQLVATRSSVVVDLQAKNRHLDGRSVHQSAVAQLSLADAYQLRSLLDEALAATELVDDPRQTRLWFGAIQPRCGVVQ
jgi:hypothetical protein